MLAIQLQPGVFQYYRLTERGLTRLFNVEKCESCGTDALAANAVGGVASDVPKYKRLGIREWVGAWPLPEQAWSDELGHCDCDSCRK